MALSVFSRMGQLDAVSIFTPPNGTTPDFGHNPPQSLALLSLILFPLLTAISLIFVSLRIFYNFTTFRKLRADDWFILLAALCATAQTIVDLTETRFARHSWDVPISWLGSSYFKKVVFTQSFLAFLSLLFAKTSIFLLFLDIFDVKPSMRYAIYAGILWTLLTYVPFFFVMPYLCAPHLGEQWTTEVGLRCNDGVNWDTTSAAMAVVLDLYILLLPMPMLRTMSLSVRRKCGLVVVFATASFALICAALTLVYRVKYMQNSDVFYNTWKLIITAIAENNVAITVACVPGFTAFTKQYILQQPRRSSPISRNHMALNSIGGTSWKSSEEIDMHSTTHLSGWRHSKDGKVYTEITNWPSVQEQAHLRDPKGISKIVDFEQRSSRGTVDGLDDPV